MSVKYYGIYIAYPPTVNLQAEGLGRHLAAFLRAAVKRKDVRFVVACPSWSRKTLFDLCKNEGIDTKNFDIESPPGQPVALTVYEAYLAYRNRPKFAGFFKRGILRLLSYGQRHRLWLERKVACARSTFVFLPIAIYLFLISIIALPFALAGGLVFFIKQISPYIKERIRQSHNISALLDKYKTITEQPKENKLAIKLYRFMAEREANLLVSRINELSHVSAWYSPAAFWPAFNQIAVPRLMCVPDVVLTDFPVGFSSVSGDRTLDDFRAVEEAILGCRHFVTYSQQVKQGTLVDRYFVPASAVQVVHHAPNTLDSWLAISGFSNAVAASDSYCHWLLSGAIHKSFNSNYTEGFLNKSVKFLFYASQFRPNKNIINLLRAYEYLLKTRFIAHKLILTGNPHALPEVWEFIKNHKLENDVLCLHGLTISELAACYKLSELAINPSLSEGGCPFTFTEALSVGTPVVMSRLPVTIEILDDSQLNELMLFDPYDWKDMADRIEWGINSKEALLEAQIPVFSRLAKRTWDDVVQEYLLILDRISGSVIADTKVAH